MTQPDNRIKRCRYCGIVGDSTTLGYEHGVTEAHHVCRDATACGLRLMMFQKVIHALRNARLPSDYPYNPSGERY